MVKWILRNSNPRRPETYYWEDDARDYYFRYSWFGDSHAPYPLFVWRVDADSDRGWYPVRIWDQNPPVQFYL